MPRPGGTVGLARKMKDAASVIELLRTNDPVLLSWLGALLRDAGIESVVLDSHTSIVEGSLGVLPRRLMVTAADEARARQVLRDAGVEHEGA